MTTDNPLNWLRADELREVAAARADALAKRLRDPAATGTDIRAKQAMVTEAVSAVLAQWNKD